ncbi:MAG TPA: cohesin domain-containing protein [Thermoanaerobaculia bacterium]|jgi:hypothetical protein|nr:cohesin domain-containing protein [Thermoanaerobaculia bacterium]
MTRRGLLSHLASLVLLAGLAACGGGGGGGSPTEPPPPVTPAVAFTGSGGSTANSITVAQGAGTNGTTLELEIRANSVQDLYGVAFDLEYPSNLLRFESSANATGFLDQGGAQASYVASLARAGLLVVGYTRLGQVAGVSGSGLLARVRFTAIATGSGTVRFSRNSAYSSQGAVMANVTWSGGTVQVNRLTP